MFSLDDLSPRRLMLALVLVAGLLAALVMLIVGGLGQNRAAAAAASAEYQYGSGGAFVIGDLTNVPFGSVLWWGAQWAKSNPMTGGPGPASFKGFENTNQTPSCGQTWSSDPGNSSGPPATVPTEMAVIVSSRTAKSGSTISGNIVHVVLVDTNPGYKPNPGHSGTGTIVAQLC